MVRPLKNGVDAEAKMMSITDKVYQVNQPLLTVGKDGISDDIPETPFPLLILSALLLMYLPSMQPYVLG